MSRAEKGMMIVDMGAGTTEITVITMGGIVVSKLLKVGGNTINASICQLVKERHHLVIGDKTAEYLEIWNRDMQFQDRDAAKPYLEEM